MFAILILLFFIQTNLIFLFKESFQKWREGFIRSVIILFTTVTFSTEFFSYFYLLKTEISIGWWILLNICLAGYLFSNYNQNIVKLFKESVSSRSVWFDGFQTKTTWVFFSLIYLTVFFTAWVAPPNTVDALTYHLPRVAHWAQAGSVEFYPTSIERQLFNAPLCEYFILQLQLLARSDHFANLVQFLSFFSCGILTSLSSQRFKLDRIGQLLTVLITASISMAILQGSSSKNDLVASLFVAGFFYYFSKAFDELQNQDFIWAGLTLGLAFLTKGNTYFFCFPISVFVLGNFLLKERWKAFNPKKISLIGLVFFIAITLNSGHYYRNWQLYGTPLKGEERVKNEKITLPIIFSNIVRNYAIHLGTKFDEVNNFTIKSVSDLLGDEKNNPASTIDNQRFEVVQSFSEESAGNLLHIFFLTISFFYFFFVYKGEKRSELFVLSFSIIFGFVLFCTFLKWNYWVSRVHSPLFILGTPLIAILICKKLANISYITVLLFFISAIFTIYVALPRSLIPYDVRCIYNVPRSELYYSNNQNLFPLFPQAMAILKEKNPQEIGFELSTDFINYNYGDWEYNFWVELKEDFAEKPIIRNVGVENVSNKIKPNQPMPEWVLSTKKENIIENTEYVVVWAKGPIRILQKKQ